MSDGRVARSARVASARAQYSRARYAAPAVVYRRNTGAERKYFDVGINAAITAGGASWTGTEVPCANYVPSNGGNPAVYTDSSLIPSEQGSGYGQIVGQKYNLDKIRVKGFVSIPTLTDQADIPPGAVCRLVLVMDTQCNGTQAQGEAILQDVGALQENVNCFTKVGSASGRYRILKDKTVTLNVSAVGTDAANTNSCGFNIAQFKLSHRFAKPPLVQILANVGGGIPATSALINYNVFLLCYCAGPAAVTTVSVLAASRCYYTD